MKTINPIILKYVYSLPFTHLTSKERMMYTHIIYNEKNLKKLFEYAKTTHLTTDHIITIMFYTQNNVIKRKFILPYLETCEPALIHILLCCNSLTKEDIIKYIVKIPNSDDALKFLKYCNKLNLKEKSDILYKSELFNILPEYELTIGCEFLKEMKQVKLPNTIKFLNKFESKQQLKILKEIHYKHITREYYITNVYNKLITNNNINDLYHLLFCQFFLTSKERLGIILLIYDLVKHEVKELKQLKECIQDLYISYKKIDGNDVMHLFNDNIIEDKHLFRRLLFDKKMNFNFTNIQNLNTDQLFLALKHWNHKNGS